MWGYHLVMSVHWVLATLKFWHHLSRGTSHQLSRMIPPPMSTLSFPQPSLQTGLGAPSERKMMTYLVRARSTGLVWSMSFSSTW